MADEGQGQMSIMDIRNKERVVEGTLRSVLDQKSCSVMRLSVPLRQLVLNSEFLSPRPLSPSPLGTQVLLGREFLSQCFDMFSQ